MRGLSYGIAILVLVGILSLAYFFSRETPVKVGDYTSDDVEALARMLASENPRESDDVQIALGWCAVNMANRIGKSVYELLAPNGQYGPQSGRYASTVNAASLRFTSIATAILDGSYSDPTGGAIQFDNPDTQDWLYENGRVSKDAAAVAADRIASGRKVFFLSGTSPDHLRFWI